MIITYFVRCIRARVSINLILCAINVIAAIPAIQKPMRSYA